MTRPEAIVTSSINSVPIFDARSIQVWLGSSMMTCRRRNLSHMWQTMGPVKVQWFNKNGAWQISESTYHRVGCLTARACLDVGLTSSNPGIWAVKLSEPCMHRGSYASCLSPSSVNDKLVWWRWELISKFLIASDYDYCKYLQVVAGLPTPTAAM